MNNCFLAYNMMNNVFDPSRALLIQRLSAAHQAQLRFANPLLGQYFGAKEQGQFRLPHSSALQLANVTNVAPSHGMLQAMMFMNSGRTNADRERILHQERVNQERAALFIADREVSQQQKLAKMCNGRALKRFEHHNTIPQLRQEAAVVRDREYDEVMPGVPQDYKEISVEKFIK